MTAFAPSTLRKAALVLLCLSSLVAAGGIVMHSIGVLGMGEEFSTVFPSAYLAELLARLTSGPVIILIVSSILLTLTLKRKALPRWLALIGGLAAAYSVTSLRGGLAHDLGHVVFNRCGNSPYGAIVFWSSLTSAGSMALATLIASQLQRQAYPSDAPASS